MTGERCAAVARDRLRGQFDDEVWAQRASEDGSGSGSESEDESVMISPRDCDPQILFLGPNGNIHYEYSRSKILLGPM